MTIKTIPLKDLIPPKANPRRGYDRQALEGLAASIRTDGLLQNLIVRRKGRRYEIVSGERRYRALCLLVERGEIADDYAVAVEVRQKLSADDALRLATVENIQREALDAIDEADAFVAMVGGGSNLADVAAKAGVSEITVKRRLALAALCEEARDAVRCGAVPLSVAEIMTLGTVEQQRQVIEQLERGYHVDARDVRDWMLDDKSTVADAIFPLERYTGTLTSDLFAEDDATYFDDVEQFGQLQREAVEALAEEHRRTAAWVEVIEEWHLPRWQYREAEEDEAADSGVVIHVTPSGRVEVVVGLVRREVPETVRGAAADVVKPKPEYAGTLARYVAAHKTLAVQKELLADPRRAREVAVVQMMLWSQQKFGVRCVAHPALRLFAMGDAASAAYEAVEAHARDFCRQLGIDADDTSYRGRASAPAWDILTNIGSDVVSLYEAVEGLADAELERLHLLLSTLCFGQSTMDEPDVHDSLFNRVAQRLGMDMADHWRPDERFLSRRSMGQLADIAQDCGAMAGLGRIKDYKKGGLVAALVRFFERTAQADEAALGEGERKGRRWLPGIMRFPAVVAQPQGDEADGDEEAEAAAA